MTSPTHSTFSARGDRHSGVARLRWWVLGTTVGGVLLMGVALVVPTPDEPVEMSIAGPITVPAVGTTAMSARVGPAPTADDRRSWLDADPALGTPSSDASITPSSDASITPSSDASITPSSDASILPRSQPARVRIPGIGVDSDLVGLGLQDDGSMEVPPGAFPAGWYTGAPTPGELGPAILAGHVDHGGSAGVFHRLGELESGDTVEVARQDGSTAVFRVTHVEQHRKDAFPTAAVYGDIDHAGLRLITCGGPFDRRVHSYTDNIVVFAELVPGAVGADGRG